MEKFVAYYRVSTDRQGRSGLGLDAQRQSVETFVNGRNWDIVAEFTEIESGKRKDRPELQKAIAACKQSNARLVIAKLDRLARNVAFIANLMDGGIDFVACDMPEANRLTLHILAAVAEHEREMISQRTKAALQAAKARGVKLGSPDPGKGSIEGVIVNRERADRFAANARPLIDDIRAAGVTSLRGIAYALNTRGVKTARGGAWHATTVRNVLERTAKPT